MGFEQSNPNNVDISTSPQTQENDDRMQWIRENKYKKESMKSINRKLASKGKEAIRFPGKAVEKARREMEEILSQQNFEENDLTPDEEEGVPITKEEVGATVEPLAAKDPQIGVVFQIGEASKKDVDIQIVLDIAQASPLEKLKYTEILKEELEKRGSPPDVFCTDVETFRSGNADTPLYEKDRLTEFLSDKQIEALTEKGVFKTIDNNGKTYYVSDYQRLAFLYIAPQLDELVSKPQFQELVAHIPEIFDLTQMDKESCLQWMIQNGLKYIDEFSSLENEYWASQGDEEASAATILKIFNRLAKYYIRYQLGNYLFHQAGRGQEGQAEIEEWKDDYWKAIKEQQHKPNQPKNRTLTPKHPDQYIAQFLAKKDQEYMNRIQLGRIFRDAITLNIPYETIIKLIEINDIKDFSQMIITFRDDVTDSIRSMASEIIEEQ